MTGFYRFGLCFSSLLFAGSLLAQQTDQTTTAPRAPARTPLPAQTTSTTSSQPLQPQSTSRPPQEPYLIEDGGISIEPMYFLNRAQPSLYGGAAATGYSSLAYPGNANNGLGVELGIPAGRTNTLRLSIMRVQGNSNSTLNGATTVFGEAYTAGDYLNANYTLNRAKLSWDYLSYTWDKSPGKLRLKTLYEMQWASIGTNVFAPFAPVTANTSTGSSDTNTVHGSRTVFLPTFGMELEQAVGSHIRWEVKGSGFGIPHHSVIWDAEASIAVRLGPVELLGGGMALHVKTSTQDSEYFTDTLSGPYVALRYYLTGRR